MKSRLSKFLAVVVLFVIACGAWTAWLLWWPDAVQPERYEQIRLGMSLDEVESVIGLKMDYFAYSGWCTTPRVIDYQGTKDLDEDARSLGWYGKTYSIDVYMDKDGRVIAKCLCEVEWQIVVPWLLEIGILDQKNRK